MLPTKKYKRAFKFVKANIRNIVSFLRATAVPAGTAEARISYGNSVCLSVCPSRPGAETTE